MTLNKIVFTEKELYAFKLNTELFKGIENNICKDKIREKAEDIGQVVYKVHGVLKNRARRRRKKSPYFSARA